MPRTRSWRPSRLQLLLALAATLVLAFVGFTVWDAWYRNWQYTGFGTKTLWDWMGLLLVPLVLALGGYVYQGLVQRHAQTSTEDTQRETALQTYLDRMSDLLIDKQLRTKEAASAEQTVARARTLTVLMRLDPVRKGYVVRFLYESRLLTSTANHVLWGAHLQGADLRGAHLSDAVLQGAHLSDAVLQEADLQRADLVGADLQRADLTGADLTGAKYDSGTKWPDGFDPQAAGALLMRQ